MPTGASAGTAGPVSASPRFLSGAARERLVPYFFLAPTMIALAVVFFYPMAMTIRMSFFSSSLRDRDGTFVGLKQFVDVISQPFFGDLLLTSALYSGGIVGFVWVVGLGTALLVRDSFRFRGLARTALIVPWAVPYVAAALIWGYMYDYEFGVFNYLLVRTGLVDEKVFFLTACPSALFSVTGVSVWKLYPFGTVMFLAALQTIPLEQYESAKIDGANVLQRFRYVTLPGVRSVSIFLVLLMTIWTFGRAFAVIFILTGGGPAGCTETIVIRSYLEAFNFHRPGTAAALGVIVLGISLVFAFVFLWISQRNRDAA